MLAHAIHNACLPSLRLGDFYLEVYVGDGTPTVVTELSVDGNLQDFQSVAVISTVVTNSLHLSLCHGS